MTAEGHLLFSVATLVLAQKLEITPALAHGDWFHMIPAVLLGSLLPDLDHPGSILGRLFRIISLPLSKLCGHRGFTHSLLAFCGLAILWETQVSPQWDISADIFHALLFGYLSHLIADMLTPAGVPFLWPLKIRFALPILGKKNNKKGERFISVLILVGALFLPPHLTVTLPSQINNWLQMYHDKRTNF
ncbi:MULTISPECIES: metal-dependent hydrolase [Proteus]|uniref:Metal-dependent hydrolase n=1 Tax=Proteus penneri TaxID=102862 RepID=A0ABS0VYW4_9GAMM|nr:MULTISPECIES: metal-dependent hydrolase [Proteus]EEG83568.1 putative membrane-bound metal-dependent hydrolase [Proteus penneri ATCC 35198]MBJ2116243.1 metal-dependent hydrolase [Proteus penneri]MCO8052315.1 metal-dependent hydrolase [Proteus penneri]MCX2586918.1 metal-dependent hydrolase [Proteus penneri]NBL77150.1 metal-dependent hydrolase [Proteus sp. G2672]